MELSAVGWTTVLIAVASVSLHRLARQRSWAQLALAAVLWALAVSLFWQAITETRLISPSTTIHILFDRLFGGP